MKRVISVILVVLMVAALFAACTQQGNTKDNQKKTQASTKSQKTEELDKWGRPVVESAIEDSKKFEGETVNFVTDSLRGSEFYVEAPDGDIINDAVYNRNLKVEDDLNIKLNFITYNGESASNEFASMLSNTVAAGTGDYDIAAGYAYFFTSAIRDLPYANLYEIEEVSSLDLSKPWWNQAYVNEVSIADQLYTITGDICLSATSNAGCIFFNKRLADEHLQDIGGTAGLYELVENYQWTIDKFTNIVKDIYVELDGDGTPSVGDFYGFSSWWSGPIPCDSFQFGMDAPITRKNDEGGIDFVYNDGKMVNVVEKLHDLNSSKGVYFDTKNYNNGEAYNTILSKFINGEIIFTAYTLDNASSLREMNDDFGILPMPMYNEEQGAYYTSQSDGYSAIAIMNDVEDVFERGDLVGTTLEKMCEESYRTVNPNYFEVVMKFRYLRTDSENKKDIAMYDYILEGNNFNFGLVFSSALENPSFQLRWLIGRDNSNAFQSQWGSKESSVLALYNGLIRWFTEE